MQAKISKFIAAVLALVIVFANSWSVVSYAAEVFLSEKELENQNTTSKDGSVDFDVHYTNGKHSAILNIDEKNTKLNIAVSLKKSGYVKDLAIDFSSSNFEIDQINDENIMKMVMQLKQQWLKRFRILMQKTRKLHSDR